MATLEIRCRPLTVDGWVWFSNSRKPLVHQATVQTSMNASLNNHLICKLQSVHRQIGFRYAAMGISAVMSHTTGVSDLGRVHKRLPPLSPNTLLFNRPSSPSTASTPILRCNHPRSRRRWPVLLAKCVPYLGPFLGRVALVSYLSSFSSVPQKCMRLPIRYKTIGLFLTRIGHLFACFPTLYVSPVCPQFQTWWEAVPLARTSWCQKVVLIWSGVFCWRHPSYIGKAWLSKSDNICSSLLLRPWHFFGALHSPELHAANSTTVACMPRVCHQPHQEGSPIISSTSLPPVVR